MNKRDEGRSAEISIGRTPTIVLPTKAEQRPTAAPYMQLNYMDEAPGWGNRFIAAVSAAQAPLATTFRRQASRDPFPLS